MEIYLACPTQSIQFTTEISAFPFLGMEFHNNIGLPLEFYDGPAVEMFGNISLRILSENPKFYLSTHVDSLNKDFDTDNYIYSCKALHTQIEGLISYLWFVKDNSANINSLFCIVGSEPKNYFVNKRNIFFSDSKGDYGPNEFTEKDLLRASELLQKFISLSGTPPVDTKMDMAANIIVKSAINNVEMVTQNRIDRAFRFLYVARSQSVLPMKISCYMSLFECLFTTDSAEVTHKVTERATLYLGGSAEEKRANWKLIKTCYGIRSKYFHGQKFDKKTTISQMKEWSCAVDELLRRILTRVLEDDHDHFLQDDSALDAWFTEMIIR